MTNPAIWFCTAAAAPIVLRVAAGSRDTADLAALEAIRAAHQPQIDALWDSGCSGWFAVMMHRASVSVAGLVDIFDGYRSEHIGVWENSERFFDFEAVAASEWFMAAVEDDAARAVRMEMYAEELARCERYAAARAAYEMALAA